MKRLLTTLSQKWPEYLLEIIVLIIGIYGAFALENWNEDKQNFKNKTVLLEALKVEFQSNLSQLDSVEKYNDMVITSCETALSLLGKEITIQNDSLYSIIGGLLPIWTFNPKNGSLRSGISSGDIHLIKNEALRNLLFGWTDLVADLTEEDQINFNNRQRDSNFFQKYVRKAAVFGSISTKLKPSVFKSTPILLFSDPHFEYLLVSQLLGKNNNKRELDVIKDQNKMILQLINKELGLQ